ncbi:MAG: hypothetical protein ACOH2H_23995 [Cypionkella sp.]
MLLHSNAINERHGRHVWHFSSGSCPSDVHRVSNVAHRPDADGGRDVYIARRNSELDGVVGQNCVDLDGDYLDPRDEQGRGGGQRIFCLQRDKGEFSCPVNVDEGVKPIAKDFFLAQPGLRRRQ